jgi:beta-phosphoglucomutase
MIRAVIFDFDGVIADTMNDNFKAWEYAFLKYNVRIEKLAYFLLEGMGPKSIANHFININKIDIELLEEIILEKENFYNKNNQFKVYSEIYSIFNFLEEKKILIGIVTGASKERFFSSLDKNLIDKTSVIITSNDVVQTKPDPEPYLKAIDKLNFSSTECLVIENAILGIKSAKAAGCICFTIETTLSKASLSASDKCFKTHGLLYEFLVSNLHII